MPRGSVCVLLPDGWAGSKVKHAIRPQDMEGKSGVVLLRHVHEELIRSGDELKLSDLADLFAAASLQDGPWCAPAPKVSAHTHAVVARAPALPDPLQLAEKAGLAPLATAEELDLAEVAKCLRSVLVKALRSRWRHRVSNVASTGEVGAVGAVGEVAAVGAVGAIAESTPRPPVKRALKPAPPTAAALAAARQERQQDERARGQCRALLDQLVSALERSAGSAEGAARHLLGDQRRAVTMQCRWVLRRIVDTIVREAREQAAHPLGSIDTPN
jgi:hypothetical protein